MAEPVADGTVREALDAVAGAHVALQRELGVPVPSARAAETYAAPVVARTMADHAERMNAARTSTAPAGVPKDHLSRGDVGDGRIPILRSPADTAPAPDRTPAEPLLAARLHALDALPEWSARLHYAARRGEDQARRVLGCNPFAHTEEWRLMETIIARYVMEVVEVSNAIFGDWRVPAAERPRIVMVG